MLNGTKPLAAFSGQYPSSLDIEEIPEGVFDPYVAAGIFVKGDTSSQAGRTERRFDWFYMLQETTSGESALTFCFTKPPLRLAGVKGLKGCKDLF
jgi:hypothetical protein